MYATTKFFRALKAVPGYRRLPVYQAAQDVQHSADGFAYNQYETLAAHMTAAFTGQHGHAVYCWSRSASRGDGRRDRDHQGLGARSERRRPRASAQRDDRGSSATAAAPGCRSGSGSPVGWAVAAWLVTHASSTTSTRSATPATSGARPTGARDGSATRLTARREPSSWADSLRPWGVSRPECAGPAWSGYLPGRGILGAPVPTGRAGRGVEQVTYIITESCVDLLDKSCIEECPVDCIYEGERMLYIHPDECVDCGACEPVCPVEAIFYEDDVPDQWKDYYRANVEFFEDIGSPGGASKVGKIHKDHRWWPRCHRRPKKTADHGRAGCPRFPWDLLAPYGDKARAHPGGIVDLSVGTPVDPVPRWRPMRCGLPPTRPAIRPPRHPAAPPGGGRVAGPAARGHRRPGGGAAADRDQGVHRRAARPARLRPGDVVVYPELAYPTYDIGARLAGARGVAADGLTSRSARSRSGWAGSTRPSNPTGRVLPRRAPAARWWTGPASAGTVLASDECYIGLGWEDRAGLGAAPGRVRRVGRGPARGALAVQAVQHGRVPGRVRDR